MKQYSFYQYALTKRSEKSEVGKLADLIFQDLSFPKFTNDYHTLSDYLETEAMFTQPMNVFDDLFESYEEWLKF
ncbi:YozE family protein [Mammaliicoccus sciuri]|uniref:YozE family protein n=1 Tax=Mammaliicoccus sciuri TaxID=1296 RepID=UPI001FB44098|nr:YozE family protein [Mammaliicoccus sciuri]MCJ1777488.1 YozE family protein [Mammaliicoccus sciuri]